VVVFQPNTSERELRRILQARNARVVDGPTVTDAYLISVPDASRAQALQALRAESAVKLAEPLDGGSAP
jgi:tRNA A22 N-methylase